MHATLIYPTQRGPIDPPVLFGKPKKAIDSRSRRTPLYARAPTRIDLAGGWTDLIPFAKQNEGLVVNAAIDLHVYVCLTPRLDSCRSLYAVDLKQFFHPVAVSAPLDGLNLPQAVLSRVCPERGCHLVTWSDVPKGSGLGASGALGVALVSLLSVFTEKKWMPHESVDIAAAIEQETGIPCGKQDHYAGLLGGINFLQCQGESVKATPLRLREQTLKALHRSLLLVYTGESHFSGKILLRFDLEGLRLGSPYSDFLKIHDKILSLV